MRRRMVVAGALAAAALVGAGLYGTLALRGNAACPVSAGLAPALAPLARGEVAAFAVDPSPKPAPVLGFLAPDGSRTTLADRRGRTVLLNLWATWCEPCKREMPALDRAEATLGGPRFEVAAVNIDTRDLDKPAAFLRGIGVTHLAGYNDPQAKVFQDLRRAGEAEGLPTTLLVGPDGCTLGRLAGWAEWASPEGIALLRASITAGG